MDVVTLAFEDEIDLGCLFVGHGLESALLDYLLVQADKTWYNYALFSRRYLFYCMCVTVNILWFVCLCKEIIRAL